MLRLDQRKFATLTHVTAGTVRRLERTQGPVSAATGLLEAMRLALEAAGVEFIDAGHYESIGGPGVRFKGQPVGADDVIDFETAVVEIALEEQMPPARPE